VLPCRLHFFNLRSARPSHAPLDMNRVLSYPSLPALAHPPARAHSSLPPSSYPFPAQPIADTRASQDVISPGVRGMHPMPPGLYSDLPPYPPLSAAAGRDGSVAPGVPTGPADAAVGAADAAADAAAGVLGMLAAGVWGGGGAGGGGRSMSEVLQPLLAGPLAAHMSAVHWMDAVLTAPPPPPPHLRSASSASGLVRTLPPPQAKGSDDASGGGKAAGGKEKGLWDGGSEDCGA
jgi:hypothetical protein